MNPTYTWSPGNLTGASQTSLAAGTYTIIVLDANLCAGSNTLTITQPTSAISAIISATVAAGCGLSSGEATVTASGGTPTYNYNWTPSGGTTAGVSNLGAGANTVTVTDIKGCTVTAVANITSTGGPTLSVISQTNVNCFGATTGTATVNGSGGTGPYSYTWTPGNLNGATQTSLSAGVYTVNIKDASGCNGTGTISITQPTASVSGVFSNTVAPTCGSSNGTASITASGGTPSYTYSWSPNSGSTQSVSNLSAGVSAVTITDSKGCVLTVSLSLNSIGGPTLSVTSQTNVNCFGANTGTATVSGSGGTGPYTYTWSPGNLLGANQSSLSAGTYTVNVKDATGCVGTGTISITQPTAAVLANMSNSPTGCGTSAGSATVTASGGTPTYTYSWSPSGGSGNTASGLATGTYSVLVTDTKGCQTTGITTISSSGGGPTLTVSSQANPLCFAANTGSASINASGTPGPYTYTWVPTGGNSASASGLSAGVYTVIASSGSSCVSTVTLSLSQPAPISLTLTSTDETCGSSDGNATLLASGGNGSLTPLWSTGSNNNSIAGLPSGLYTVTVTDANNCSATGSVVVGLTGSLIVSAGAGSTIYPGESTVLNGSVPSGAFVSWSPPGSLSCPTCPITSAAPGSTTIYTITADLNGCVGFDTVTVFVDVLCGELFVPSAFSPNDDGQNDVLYVMSNCISNMEFVIFDRWGEKVFESSNQAFGWDGTFNGKKMTPAAFAYYLKATVKGEEVIQKGNISLVK